MRLIGDCGDVDPSLYSDVCSIEDSQTLADMFCEKMGWDRVIVEHGRKTQRRHGVIYPLEDPPRMVLHKPSIGAIIHEMAHMINRELKRNVKHNQSFKSTQKMLLKLWQGNKS